MHHVQGSVLTLGGDPFETAAEHSDTVAQKRAVSRIVNVAFHDTGVRSEEHTSELQSLRHLVCRLLLEKKKYKTRLTPTSAINCTRLIVTERLCMQRGN